MTKALRLKNEFLSRSRGPDGKLQCANVTEPFGVGQAERYHMMSWAGMRRINDDDLPALVDAAETPEIERRVKRGGEYSQIGIASDFDAA